MQLLQDVFIIEQLQVLTEGKANDTMKIRGVFGRCNEKNNNGRIYPTKVLEGQLSKVQPLISERRLCGELDHPSNDTVRLSNASHLITKLEMKGDELIGEAEVLKTPAGLTAQALINGGVKIGISSRGMGTLSEDHITGHKVVNEDFRLVTFDLVADPSTRGAYPGLSESTESQFVRTSQDKLGKEGNFLTMLESRMRKAYKPFIEEAKLLSNKESVKLVTKKLQADKEEADEENQKLKTTRMKEAFEYIKADGHWHRIAELLGAAINEDLAADIMKQKAEDEGIGIAAGERRRGLRGHQGRQLKMSRSHEKKMGRIATKQGVRHTRKMARAEGKAGVTKAKYGTKAAKHGAKTSEITGRGEGAGIAAKAEGQGAAARTMGQAAGEAEALKAKGQAQAGVTKAQGGVDAKRATDVGAAKTAGKVERQTGREAAKTSAQGKAIAAPGKAAAGLKKGAEATVDATAKKLPGAARKAGELTGKAGRGLAAGVRKAGEAIAQRRSNTPLRGAKSGTKVGTPTNPNTQTAAAPKKVGSKEEWAKAGASGRGRGRAARRALGRDPAPAATAPAATAKKKPEFGAGVPKKFGAGVNSSTSYKQIGRILAETLGWKL